LCFHFSVHIFSFWPLAPDIHHEAIGGFNYLIALQFLALVLGYD
jgi:hypothetical protein